MKLNEITKYFVTFIDDYFRWTKQLFCISAFKHYESRVKIQKRSKIKCIQMDNGRKHINKEFVEFLNLIQRTSIAYNP